MNTEFDIAIVGMAGRFPGARNLEEFWNNLTNGVDSITRFSDEEILASGVPESFLKKQNYVKAAPVLHEPGHFDAAYFGFSPLEAKMLDPQHRLLLELAHEALENAAYDPERYQGRIGVYSGTALNTYLTSVGLHGRLAEDYIPTLIGNDKDFLSTRISYKLNLKGPSITVQTACSTSMVAIHLARQSLLSQEIDMALAGAVSVRVPHRAGYFCDGGGVVSPDGMVRTFDASANGTVFGSGGGILVLKRLADALSDGDVIHAVIKGSAVNNDGSEKAGYTAPSVNSQADAVIEALGNAGLEADDITYLEAHGSGTPLGDPIEISALTKAFRTFTDRSSYCAVGSVKTNIGHLDAAAAIAGIIKTVLSLKHRQLPPNLHFTKPNPEIDFANTPFYVNTKLQEWRCEGPRRAGVMSTGMGGTNAHVILEESPQTANSTDGQSPHLLVLSAKTQTALDAATSQLQEFLVRNESVNMADVAFTLQVGRKARQHRRCLVSADRQDAIAALGQRDSQRILSSITGQSRSPVIFLFPGIGDHYVGMAHDLYENWPVFRQEIDRCASILAEHLGTDIREIIYPPGQPWKKQDKPRGIDLKQMLGRKDSPKDQESATLNQTLFAQPALFSIEYALARLWDSLGVTPNAMIGHSMGEYVAACLSGVLSLPDALSLIATRARLVNELPQGAMLAVTLREDELLPILPEHLSISLINSPRLSVVAGPVQTVAEFEETLKSKDIISRRVQNAHAFHSKMLDPIVAPLEAEVRKLQLRPPTIPYISNVTGKWITAAEATNPAYWAIHATRTARFNDALKELWNHENPILLEAGPGRTLSVLAIQHPSRPNGLVPQAVSSLRHQYENQSDVEHLSHALGKLWLSGTNIRWENAWTGQRRNRVALPTYPFERQYYWLQLQPIPESHSRPESALKKNPDLAKWLYIPSWKRLLSKSLDTDALALPSQRAQSSLVFMDDSGFGSLLVERLRSAGHRVSIVTTGNCFRETTPGSFTIQPEQAEHYDSLLRALQASQSLPNRVFHAWSITGNSSDGPGIDSFSSAQTAGFYSLLFLAKALGTRGIGQAVELYTLSNNIHEVCRTEMISPDKSTALAPCVVIRQEYPSIRVKNIDFESLDDAASWEQAVNAVIGEMLAPDSALFIAYRNGQRWIQSYEPLESTAANSNDSSFRKQGVYLVTGGLGHIGLAISEYLAREYQARLILVGRSDLPDHKDWPALLRNSQDRSLAQKLEVLQQIEQHGGKVLYAKASVADRAAMQKVVNEAYQHFGALHGVIHGAGVVRNAGFTEIKDTDPVTCDIHFHAKAHGLIALEQAIEGKPLDFCLLLSSLSSILGGIGHAAYSASNLFMDSFARRHNRTSRVPWLSVNWDLWHLGENKDAGLGLGTTVKDFYMEPAEAMTVMESALRLKSAGQLVVSTGNLHTRMQQWVQLESLERSPAQTTPATRRRVLKPEDAPRDEVEQQVAEIWQNALGIETVGINENFSQLGGHSLLAIRIVSEMRDAFQMDLPLKTLFEAPTVAELSHVVREQLVAEIDALTDDEARQLVASA